MAIDELRDYETTFIITPELTEEEYKEIITWFNGLLQKEEGSIENQEIWGMRKLAYPIERKTSGYYVYTQYKVKASAIAEIERRLDIDTRIIRYLTVKLGKYALEYAQKRLEKQKSRSAN